LANITAQDNVLFIRGGICPFSAILLHQMTGAKVTVIDNNEKCVPKAKQVIERLGLSEQIRVVLQDGLCSDIEEYSVIHIAVQVDPMERVIAEVERRMSPGTKLLIRQPKKSLCCMYNKFTGAMLACCTYVTHQSRIVGSTFLYKAM
jgi:2-polyprenyl-3-methyl-5-hydroxy-6-metoxy-1,4-benzoquinol methylase